jgi:hypothetical protein
MCASDELRTATPYAFDRVQKAVHLICDPFDNVVSRFHLHTKQRRTKSQEFGREAFRAYCREDHPVNRQRNLEMFLGESQISKVHDIPCLNDLVKYTVWHNHAFDTSAKLELDTMLVHYGWYASRFQATKNKLLDFWA